MDTKTDNVVKLGRQKTAPVALTEAKIRNALPRASRYRISDTTIPGLNLTVQPSGERAFYVRARLGTGRGAALIDFRLGDPRTLPLADARRVALAALADLRQGKDPRKAQPTSTGRLATVLDLYEQDLARRQIVKAKDALSCLRRNLHMHLRQQIDTLSRAEIVARIDALTPGAAQDFRKHVTAFLAFAERAGQVPPPHVMAGYRRARTSRAQRLEQTRLTYTCEDALKRLHAAIDGLSNPTSRDLMHLGLLTGLRRGELASLTHTHLRDLDGPDPRIELPASITKTGDARALPLGPRSLALLRSQPRHAGTALVFPGRNLGPISGWTKHLAPLKKALDEPRFGLHSLRRSYRSGLSDLGVPFEVAEVMIGHRRPGLAGIYDKSEIWDQRQGAQAKWEAYLSEITRPLPQP